MIYFKMFFYILIFNFILLSLHKVYFIQAATGFDSVDSITTETFNNAKQSSSKIEFFIGRIFSGAKFDLPSGDPSLEDSVDHVGIQNIENANSAGIYREKNPKKIKTDKESTGLQVDAYFVPRYAQLNENIDSQVFYTLNALNNASLPIKTIWVVISRNLHSGWTTDTNLNVNCLTRILTQFKSNKEGNKFQIGIMTRQEALEEIVGKEGQINAKTPFETNLWWKNCDGNSGTARIDSWAKKNLKIEGSLAIIGKGVVQTPTITQNKCGVDNFGVSELYFNREN
ncbi:hypothetical protein Mgra_00002517 [Meloidogyne graminicola]|uniref:Uncharacterized protein n=1 Tax=Meloidogyne graminicola TaxID=189291 RepID=A0A8S9ZWF7_9BILA|nr:hypothetical protein Mgra_00002517 [Meloidogyne graminicola]